MTVIEPIEQDGLLYREGDPVRDFDAIIALWNLVDWGPVDPGYFRRRYFEGPARAALFQVIENELGELVGSELEDFLEVQLDDRRELFGTAHATIVHPELRSSRTGGSRTDGTHPASVMWSQLKATLPRLGIGGTFGIPNPLWNRWPSTDPFPSASRDFPAVRLELADASTGDAPLQVSRIRFFHSGYDRLWEQARVGLGIRNAIVRDARWLNHLRQGDLNLECRDPETHELVGYASFWSRPETARLDDLLAVDQERLDEVLRSATRWLIDHPDQHRMRHFSALAHPLYEPALRGLGAHDLDPETWAFRLTLGTVAADVPIDERHDPALWYVTTGDS